MSQFQEYFSQLTIDSNRQNPWFPEYFSAYAECNLETDSCMRNQSTTDFARYEQDDVAPLVIDAVYTYAHALHFLNDNCQLLIRWDRINGSCVGQVKKLNGSVLLRYISELDFVNNITGNLILRERLN